MRHETRHVTPFIANPGDVPERSVRIGRLRRLPLRIQNVDLRVGERTANGDRLPGCERRGGGPHGGFSGTVRVDQPLVPPLLGHLRRARPHIGIHDMREQMQVLDCRGTDAVHIALRFIDDGERCCL